MKRAADEVRSAIDEYIGYTPLVTHVRPETTLPELEALEAIRTHAWQVALHGPDSLLPDVLRCDRCHRPMAQCHRPLGVGSCR